MWLKKVIKRIRGKRGAKKYYYYNLGIAAGKHAMEEMKKDYNVERWKKAINKKGKD